MAVSAVSSEGAAARQVAAEIARIERRADQDRKTEASTGSDTADIQVHATPQSPHVVASGPLPPIVKGGLADQVRISIEAQLLIQKAAKAEESAETPKEQEAAEATQAQAAQAVQAEEDAKAALSASAGGESGNATNDSSAKADARADFNAHAAKRPSFFNQPKDNVSQESDSKVRAELNSSSKRVDSPEALVKNMLSAGSSDSRARAQVSNSNSSASKAEAVRKELGLTSDDSSRKSGIRMVAKPEGSLQAEDRADKNGEALKEFAENRGQ